MDWMVHTLKPKIDRDFRTISDRKHTFIAGSSMGGLMSLYAVTQYNAVFGRAAALSPSVWTSVDKLEQLIRRTKIRQNTVIYMDYGSVELEQRPKVYRDFERIAAAFFQKRALLEVRIVPGGTHCEASWERQIPFFMNTLLYEEYRDGSTIQKRIQSGSWAGYGVQDLWTQRQTGAFYPMSGRKIF